MIVFNERAHTYTDTETNQTLMSVTTLISKYKPPFDRIGNATRVAHRQGVSVEFILEEWESELKRACNNGTHLHKIMEKYILHKEEDKTYSTLYESYNEIAKNLFKYSTNVLCEAGVGDTELNIAGTADLIYENNTHFYIGDFKTNKHFRFTSAYNSYFTAPIDHLNICEFNTYALQLSMYALLYEKMTNKKCAGLVIFHLDSNNKWYPINVNYMKKEAIALIENYNNPN